MKLCVFCGREFSAVDRRTICCSQLCGARLASRRRAEKFARERRVQLGHGITAIKRWSTCGYPSLTLSFESEAARQAFKAKVGGSQRRGLWLNVTGHTALRAARLIGLELGWKPKNRRMAEVTDEELVADARRFKTRTAWGLGSTKNRAEVMTNRRHLISACTAHMEPPAGPGYRQHQVYRYDLSDDSVYVGLTCRPKRRHDTHLIEGPVSQKLKRGISHTLTIVGEKLTPLEARKLEIELIERLRKEGKLLLNLTGGGELACLRSRFSYESVLAASQGCTSRFQFHERHGSEYRAAKKYGWLDRLAAERGWPAHSNYRHTYESCLAQARKHGGGRAWAKADPTSYCAASKRGWLIEINRQLR